MATTAIEWTRNDDGSAGRTWNPTTGCDRVSPGCDHCYALTQANRLKGMGSAKYQTDGDPLTSGPGFGLAVHDDVVRAPLGWRKPSRVFVNSMSDLFHDRVPDAFLARVFAVMVAAPRHTFQILTKRHARMRAVLSTPEFWQAVSVELGGLWGTSVPAPLTYVPAWIWMGVSVENQRWADIRIPALMETPAAVRFISAEPLLGPIELDEWWLHGRPDCACDDPAGCASLDWVIVGGESGANHRPAQLDWFRELRDQCTAAGVPFFFKQHGGRTPKAGGRLLDGVTWDQYPQQEVPA